MSVSTFAACFAEGTKPAPGTEVPGGAGEGGPSVPHGSGGDTGGAGEGPGSSAGLPNLPGAGAGGEAGGEGEQLPFSCEDADAEPLPARGAVMSPDAPETPDGGDEIITVEKEDLFKEFVKQTCGSDSCHGGGDQPNLQAPEVFKMTLDSFGERPELGTEALALIMSSDEDAVMPPGSGNGSKRDKDNPVRKLGERLLAWQEAGFPESFEITVSGEPVDPDLPEDPYRLSPELGNKLTNLGSCIPKRAASLRAEDDEMADKDVLFASLESSDELPDTILETDLVSLDSTALTRRRVFSYAPTYPLFSDHAGKMRYVRVPLGESIRFDPETNDFHIPDNTRFYKTFLKEVRDKDGDVGFRKMETRLIVVRSDEQLPDGTFRPRALRASYAWDKDEGMARRVKDPFRDGTLAADRLCAYVVDESEPRDPALNPVSDQLSSDTCTYMTEEELEDPASGRIRHYAIPSTQRCDQCHMGANNRSYILGFSPWQVDRRADGEGGVYEAPKTDELSQLARLIEYGVISGIAPGEAKLEQSQGAREPRNDYELKAQAYMIGNCAFCHNPSGFPVAENAALRPFDLYPSDTGGIFEFSLERYSPRAKAGPGQNVRFPYITPAFGDHNLRNQSAQVGKSFFPDQTRPPVLDWESRPPDRINELADPFYGAFTFLGPWRSLIWRNVYTPFTYQEDNTIFIHMPRNVAGYDCRAQKIMAEWMLSIPAALKASWEGEDQPVFEATDRTLPPKEYRNALAAAAKRVEDYRGSITGSHCPSDDDIVDPKVVLSALVPGTSNKKLRASPIDEGIFDNPRLNPDNDIPLLDAVPDHAHWVPTDTTDAAGRWVPRRRNWEAVLATREVPVSAGLSRVIDDLQDLHLSPADREFALESQPMGLWHEECQSDREASASPTAGELVEELQSNPELPLRRWLSGRVYSGELDSKRDVAARVHSQSRGEAVFRTICQNCHGKAIDSKSPLAATIIELTGAQTRVANFVNGLFGPASAPGAFAQQEFLIDRGATPEEWLVRYLLFMGLGGTEADIPKAVLNLVATSPFYGAGVTAGVSSPNMLDSAEQLCVKVLGNKRVLDRVERAPQLSSIDSPVFGTNNAHYELWESLCTFKNEPVVRVFWGVGDALQALATTVYRAKDASGNWVYPSDHLVGNQNGELELGIQASNTLPWCIEQNENSRVPALVWAESVGLPEASIPYCPPSLLAEALGHRVHRLAIQISGAGGPDPSVPLGNQDFTERWLRRGAMTVGTSAYYFMRGFTSGEVEPSQPFDFCRE